MPFYSKKTVVRDYMCIMQEHKELLEKLNYFEEKDIKHVRSPTLQIKTIGKDDQNAYILGQKVKIKEIMFC